MRLTTMTDYALRLLMYVAQRPERLCTIAEVAQAHGVSEAHLMKITHHLARGGFLETVRGKGGGMRLAAAAGADQPRRGGARGRARLHARRVLRGRQRLRADRQLPARRRDLGCAGGVPRAP